MAELALFSQTSARALAQGGFAFIGLLPSGICSTQKVSGHRKKHQGGEATRKKKIVGPPSKALVVAPSMQKPKPSQEDHNQTFLG